MVQALYVSPDQVAIVPGRFFAFWNNITPAGQNQLIAEASAKVDQILGVPEVGILTQTGITATIRVSRNRDTLFLPSKPITTVEALTVQPIAGGVYTLPVRMVDVPGLPATVQIWGGQGLKFVGDPSGQVAIPSWGRDEVPFQEDDTVTVTYDCGYAATDLPAPIIRATRMILASLLFGEADNPEGAFMISEDGASHRYGSTRAEINPVEDDAVSLLQPYRLEVFSN